MEEIVKLVCEKTGLSKENATVAVETVVGYLKAKLPAPLAGQIDSLLAGGAPSLGGAGDLMKGLGGLFNK